MVENPRETPCAGAYKPVNAPESVSVKEDATGFPLALRGKWRQHIESIEDRWRLDDEWWRTEPVSRFYYAIRLATGQKLTIYKDLITGDWYRQPY